jgi:hypothetical protein
MTLRHWHVALGIVLGSFACDSPVALDLAKNPLIQTDSLEYTLRADRNGWAVDIPYVFTNLTGATVYLSNCRGGFALHLERQVGGAWQTAWSPAVLLCSSPSIGIRRGAQFERVLDVWGATPGGHTYPHFDIMDPSGTYRIVWDAAYSDDGPIPLEMRVSNAFELVVAE